MKSFSERNPVVVALAGTLGIVMATGLAYKAEALPVVGGGPTYTAYFSESAGLKDGTEVRIAGVRVGAVRDVSLVDDRVRVDFRVKDAWVGESSRAAIKIKTALGQKYLAIDSQGSKPLAEGGSIPLERTTSPFDVQEAFAGLTDTFQGIDSAQLATSFETLSTTFEKTPPAVRGALDGLTALSKTVADRDTELARLLDNTETITGTLAQRSPEIAKLITDGNLLLAELDKRREEISTLLKNTQTFSSQVSGLVKDNQTQLRPALEKLERVTTLLERHQADLENAVKLADNYYSLLTSTMGNGRWMDSYICGLFDAQGKPVLDAEADRTCTPQAGGGR